MWSRDIVPHLRQVDLVDTLRVTQPILLSVGLLVLPSRVLLQLLQVPIPRHLEVDTDPTVQRKGGEIEMQIRNTGLDNHGYDPVRLLVVRDPDLGRMPGRNEALDTRRELFPQWVRELIKLVRFAAMTVLDRHAGSLCPVGDIDTVVEILIEGLVLSQRHVAAEGQSLGVGENTLGEDGQVNPFISLFVDDGPHLGLDLELDVATRDFPRVWVVHNSCKQEIGHLLGHVIEWLDVADARLPRAQWTIGIGHQSHRRSHLELSWWRWRSWCRL